MEKILSNSRCKFPIFLTKLTFSVLKFLQWLCIPSRSLSAPLQKLCGVAKILYSQLIVLECCRLRRWDFPFVRWRLTFAPIKLQNPQLLCCGDVISINWWDVHVEGQGVILLACAGMWKGQGLMLHHVVVILQCGVISMQKRPGFMWLVTCHGHAAHTCAETLAAAVLQCRTK